MKNLINENLISSEVLYDFNSVIKKLNLTNSKFSYEPFIHGFILHTGEIYLIIDYESSGNYLIKVLDNKNSALVIKGFKSGKNISNSKMIAPNPFICLEDNAIKYFKLITTDNKIENPIFEQSSFATNQIYYSPPLSPVTSIHQSNHNENIIKIMDKLIEMHFKNNTYNNSNNYLNNQSVNSVKSINLNEIIPRKSSGNINLNEINPINNNQPSKNKNSINYQEIIKMQKWKNELYSMLF